MKKCQKCGGVLRFEPSVQSLRCIKCGNEYNVSKVRKFDKHPFEMEKQTLEKNATTKDFNIHCESCGGVINGETFTISDICKYCGAVITAKLDGELAPDAVVPFVFDRKEAKSKFKDGLKKKWFLPNRLKHGKIKEEIESVYIPAYMCDIITRNEYSGKLYTENKRANGDVDVSYKHISGIENVVENNLLMECSKHMTQITLKKITPFDISSAVKFSPSYLMGYSVEYYEKNLEDCKAALKTMATANVRRAILSHYSYDGVSYLRISTYYYDCKYSKVILPTYRIKYKFGNKERITFMNGQTGKIGGNLPRSGWKIFAFVIGIMAGIGVIACIMAYIIAML